MLQNITFYDNCIGAHHDQTDMVLWAFNSENRSDPSGPTVYGKISYSMFRGEIHINMVETFEPFKRQGIATALFKELQRLNPGVNIRPGMFTDEGTAWWRSAVPPKRYRRNVDIDPQEQERQTKIRTALQQGDRVSIQGLLQPAEKALISLYDYLTDNQLLRRTHFDIQTASELLRYYYQSQGFASDHRSADSYLSPSGKTKIKFLARNMQILSGGRGAWHKTKSLAVSEAALNLTQKAAALFGHQQAEKIALKKAAKKEKVLTKKTENKQRQLDDLYSLWALSNSLEPEARLAWQAEYLEDSHHVQDILSTAYLTHSGQDKESLEKRFSIETPPLFTEKSPKEIQIETVLKNKTIPIIYQRQDSNLIINIGGLPINPVTMRMDFIIGMDLKDPYGIAGHIAFSKNREPQAYLFMIIAGNDKKQGFGRELLRLFCRVIKAYGLTKFIAVSVGEEGAAFFTRLHQTGELGIQVQAGKHWLISCQNIYTPEQRQLFKPNPKYRRNTDEELRKLERDFRKGTIEPEVIATAYLRTGMDREEATAGLITLGAEVMESHRVLSEITKVLLQEWKLIRYGVTGNEEDGWEVNDAHYTGETIMLPPDVSHSEILEAMESEGLLTLKMIEIDEELSRDNTIVFCRSDSQRPLGEIEKKV